MSGSRQVASGWSATTYATAERRRPSTRGTICAISPPTRRRCQRLSELTPPTLVVHGRADPFFPVGNGEALADAIPAARLLVLDDMGTALRDAAVPLRSPPQCLPSDSAAGPAAAVGTLRLADLDVGNGRFPPVGDAPSTVGPAET